MTFVSLGKRDLWEWGAAGGGGGLRGGATLAHRTPGPIVSKERMPQVTMPYPEQLADTATHSCPVFFRALSPLKNISVSLQLTPPSEKDARHQKLDRAEQGPVPKEQLFSLVLPNVTQH